MHIKYLIMAKEIKNVISSILSNQNDWKIKLLQSWPEIIGQLKSKVVLEKINSDSLVIGVYDSCWLQELYLLSPILLKKINKKLETQCFKRLRFKQIDIKSYKKSEKAEKYDHKKTVIVLTKKENEALEKIPEKIKDADLCDSIKNFLIRCHVNQELHLLEIQTQKIKAQELKAVKLKALDVQNQKLKSWQFVS